MARVHAPQVLIADEPTTALDVTIQTQVLDVVRDVRRITGAAIVLITHDLGVVAEIADRVVVMYARRVVETGDVFDVFRSPRHPYTLALLPSLPRLDSDARRLELTPGEPPSLAPLPSGASRPRCTLRQRRDRCIGQVPALTAAGAPGRHSACHFCDALERTAKRQ